MAGPWDKYANATQPWMRYQPRQATLRADNPTMSERIPIAVKSGLRALGLNKFAANAFGSPIADVLGYSPVGAVAQSWDAGQAAAGQRGMLGKVAGLGGGMALAALGAVPGGKGLAGKAEREALDFATKGYKEARLGNTVVGYTVNPANRAVEINTVKTPAAMRGQGSARAAMNDVISAADNAGYQLHLTPDPMDAATSKSKLTAFYKSLGFAPNAGKSRDFSTRAAMVRAPALPALAMDEASRMARAAEQGFTVDAYHGTRAPDFSQFSDAAVGSQTDDGWLGAAHYFAPNPKETAGYSMYGARGESVSGGRTIPAKLRMANPHYTYNDSLSKEEVDAIKAAGHDGIIRLGHGPDDVQEYAIFDPANIRSKFAAFDPAKRGSSNLLAGLGAGAVAVPTIYQMLGVPDPDAKTQY